MKILAAPFVILVSATWACGGTTTDPGSPGQGGQAGSAGTGGIGPIDPADAMDVRPDQPANLRVPLNHRAAPDKCSTGRPVSDAGLPDPPDAGAQCRSDADCRDGKNGRCVAMGFERDAGWNLVCSYDRCLSDDDCGGVHACSCRESQFRLGDPVRRERIFEANECLLGNCRVDADCGPGANCSPSNSDCGSIWGYVGLWCHQASDECTDDADCEGFDAGPLSGGPAYCAYDPTRSHWACFRRINVCLDGGAY